MKLWVKLCLTISAVITLLFGIGGYLIIQKSFDFSLEQIIRQYEYQHTNSRIFFEDKIFSEMQSNNEISTQIILDSAEFLGSLSSFGMFYENSHVLYSSSTMPKDKTFVKELINEKDGYIAKNYGDKTLLGVVSLEHINGKDIYLITVNDISEVYIQRNEQYQQMVFLVISLLFITVFFVILISIRITRPLKKLANASEEIASGCYGQRTGINSTDEIGILSHSFDKMAEAVEEKVSSLEQAIRSRDDFVSNFSHELKTPMTAIMGYADMLRSYENEPEVQIKAANYIYNESKQLSELSLKLMDLMALSEEHIQLVPTNTEYFRIGSTSNITWDLQPATVLADQLLIQRVLLNLCLNSNKAGANSIVVCGCVEDGRYKITVKDNGCGMLSKEVTRITEPFYRIDNVRSRENGGFGLGLALCEKILAVHDTSLTINSTPNVKTAISFKLLLHREAINK